MGVSTRLFIDIVKNILILHFSSKKTYFKTNELVLQVGPGNTLHIIIVLCTLTVPLEIKLTELHFCMNSGPLNYIHVRGYERDLLYNCVSTATSI